ncbi:MAG: SDR family oxidoreductase [Rhodospirillales bacterium]|nr:SDR family oxidoreductase [Rhodospirillales bacterium]
MSKKVALVFGGSRGIGAACVKALTDAGFDLAYTYVSNPPATATPGVKAYAADIRDLDAVARVFADVEKDFGAAPTCVVANAGINVAPGPITGFDPDDFRKLVDVNIVGAFNILTEAGKRVPDGGTIIAITTSMVRFAPPNGGAYTATKAAVESMVRAMSKELASRQVRVNAVAPGPVDTDLFRIGKSDEVIAKMASFSPLNRIADPSEIAEVVSFLASEKSSWVLGQVVQPNGGMV